MNETEKNTIDLIKAVFANRVDTVKQIISSQNFKQSVLTDVFGVLLKIENKDDENSQDEIHDIFPLYYLTLCNKIYLESDNWNEFYKETVKRNLEGCYNLIKYWKELGFAVDITIDFSKFRELCAHFPYGDDEMEWLLDGDINKLKTLGYDEKECLLCYSILIYNKPVIWELLEQKVNPDVWISGNCKPDQCSMAEGMNGLNTIRDSLSDPQICYGYDLYYDEMKLDKMPYPDYNQFRAIFGGAAYQEILNKINQEGTHLKAI